MIYALDQQLAGVALVVDAKRQDGPLRTSASLLQISAAVLSATTEQLSLITSLGQRADDARTPRFWMAAVLLEQGARCYRMNSERETPRSRSARQSN